MKVLTAKGGEISLTDELRSMVAYIDDGRLFISKSHVLFFYVFRGGGGGNNAGGKLPTSHLAFKEEL